jgi:hypothetical protein
MIRFYFALLFETATADRRFLNLGARSLLFSRRATPSRAVVTLFSKGTVGRRGIGARLFGWRVEPARAFKAYYALKAVERRRPRLRQPCENRRNHAEHQHSWPRIGPWQNQKWNAVAENQKDYPSGSTAIFTGGSLAGAPKATGAACSGR